MPSARYIRNPTPFHMLCTTSNDAALNRANRHAHDNALADHANRAGTNEPRDPRPAPGKPVAPADIFPRRKPLATITTNTTAANASATKSGNEDGDEDLAAKARHTAACRADLQRIDNKRVVAANRLMRRHNAAVERAARPAVLDRASGSGVLKVAAAAAAAPKPKVAKAKGPLTAAQKQLRKAFK